MSKVIDAYYRQLDTPYILLQKKKSSLMRNPDIQQEFEHWIETGAYEKNGVRVEDYTAQDLAYLSEYIDGEGAFMLLIELRENPERAKKRINEGFQMK